MDFKTFAINFLTKDLSVIMTIITIVARFIGIGFVLVGLSRLYKMSSNSMMHRVTMMPTILFFVVGAIFAAYTPVLIAFSNSLFGLVSGGGLTPADSANILLYRGGALGSPCASYSAGGYEDSHPFCPVLGYANMITTSVGVDYSTIISAITYALLFVVGVIAFLRGLSLLIKAGDGAQPGTLPKAITHIVAGLVGVNAQVIFDMLQGIYQGLVPSSS